MWEVAKAELQRERDDLTSRLSRKTAECQALTAECQALGQETELLVAAEEELAPALSDHWSDVCAAFADEDAHHLYVSPERIQAALVLGAAGKWHRFEQQLRLLELDWRDVLMVGGLAYEDWPAQLAAALPAEPDEPGKPVRRPGLPPAQARSARRDASSPRRTVARRQGWPGPR